MNFSEVQSALSAALSIHGDSVDFTLFPQEFTEAAFELATLIAKCLSSSLRDRKAKRKLRALNPENKRHLKTELLKQLNLTQDSIQFNALLELLVFISRSAP